MSGPPFSVLRHALAGLVVAGLSLALPASADDLARAWLSIDAASGRVLAARAPTKPSYPASLVKLMTVYMLLVAVDNGALELSTELTASARAASQPPARLGLRRGEGLAAEDAIRALMVRSANDVAVMVAEHVGGTEPRFVRQMNRAARALGMTRTVFRNPSGLPDEDQVTTALDSTLLLDALLRRFPWVVELLAATEFLHRGRTLTRAHPLLRSTPRIDALKTGFTCRSGYNIAVAAAQAGQRVITIVLGAASASARDRRAVALITDSFSQLGQRTVPLESLERRPSRALGVNQIPLAERCR